MSQPRPMVEIEWWDTVADHGWKSTDEAQRLVGKDLHHRSIGYVLRDDEDGVLLAHAYGENYEGVMCPELIPRVAVKKVTKLRR